MGVPELYFKTEKWVHRVGTLMGALRQGVWLGLMDGESLNRLTALSYDNSQMYKAEEHNSYGLFDWEQTVIKRYFANCRSVLVGGAGAAREVMALAARGLSVAAFECNLELVKRGDELLAKSGVAAKYELAPPNELPPGLSGSFDGAVLGWSALTHIPGREARVRLMRAMGVHMPTGAPLLVSFLPRQPHRADGIIAGVANAIRFVRRAKPKAERGDMLMFQFRHLFTEAEVRGEMSGAGFDMVQFSDIPYGHAVGVKK